MCIDVDFGVNKDLILFIVVGNMGNVFWIIFDVIEVNFVLDYEVINKYVILIESKDNGSLWRFLIVIVDIDIIFVYVYLCFVLNI